MKSSLGVKNGGKLLRGIGIFSNQRLAIDILAFEPYLHVCLAFPWQSRINMFFLTT